MSDIVEAGIVEYIESGIVLLLAHWITVVAFCIVTAAPAAGSNIWRTRILTLRGRRTIWWSTSVTVKCERHFSWQAQYLDVFGKLGLSLVMAGAVFWWRGLAFDFLASYVGVYYSWNEEHKGKHNNAGCRAVFAFFQCNFLPTKQCKAKHVNNQPTNQPNKHNKPTTKQRQSLSSVHRVWRSQIAQQNDVLQLNGTIPAMAKARGLTMPSGNGGGLPDQIPELLSSSWRLTLTRCHKMSGAFEWERRSQTDTSTMVVLDHESMKQELLNTDLSPGDVPTSGLQIP